jgi:hypothetical protein
MLTITIQAAAFVLALTWVLASLVVGCGLVLMLPTVRVAALE